MPRTATTNRKPAARKPATRKPAKPATEPAPAFEPIERGGATVTVADGVCTITFDVGAVQRESTSGQSDIIADLGFKGAAAKLPDGTRVKLMAWRKRS